jgi:hypothetical protein
MKKPLTFFGQVQHGDKGATLDIPNKHEIAQRAYEAFGECRVTVTIAPIKARRSDAQNAYYWSVVLPHIYQGFIDAGNEVALQDVHDFLKDRFLEATQINDRHGNPIGQQRKTTSMLNKEQFAAYLNECIRFAAEYFSINVPEAVNEGRFPENER